MLKNVFILLVAISFLNSCTTEKSKVDLIIHNAVIYSVDSSFSIHQAMAIRDGKIVELNSNEVIFKKFDCKEKRDLKGKAVFPGFIDAHCHFLGYGMGLQQVNLVGTKSFNHVVERVVNFTKNKPADNTNLPSPSNKKNWIIGRGWDQNDWENKQYPNKKILDSIFPDTPVMLTRIDGHAALVNSEALKRANITIKTLNVIGGEIEMSNGKLTGILIDNAVDLVKSFIPENTKEKIVSALLNAQNNCLAMGLTTVDDAGLMKSDIDVIDEIQQSGKLKMRMYVMLSDSLPNYDYYLKHGPYKTERLNVCSFKFYADGALGSRGACLLQEYEDKQKWKGFLLSEREHFGKYAKIMFEKGFQMNTHCIGDSAYKIILNAYLKAGAKKNNRWRIEHAQVVNPNEMKISDGIIPSVQPTHATSDMYWAKERLGEKRVKHAYAYKELLTVCGLVALGTDFPVEDISPFKTFFSAVARQDAKGFPKDGFQTENALSREETLKGMTIWAAYSNFEEKEKGSLEKGKFADFIVLDTDIMKCKINDVLKTKVLSTYIDGEKVFESK
ncbi:MAG: amidohydrolase [Bacteroidota bacterium]|nr:amidohydrolase [Bacteroidota bacterium]MDP3144066.1 amidohydrolase [Bacteroidota bacterium]